MNFLWCFIVGGLWCVIAQLFIDLTDMTPAHVLVSYVVLGVILGGIGIYEKIVDIAGAGATVVLVGFGYNLAKGVKEAVDSNGLIGILTGGLTACSAGISVAITFAFVLSLFFKAKEK